MPTRPQGHRRWCRRRGGHNRRWVFRSSSWSPLFYHHYINRYRKIIITSFVITQLKPAKDHPSKHWIRGRDGIFVWYHRCWYFSKQIWLNLEIFGQIYQIWFKIQAVYVLYFGRKGAPRGCTINIGQGHGVHITFVGPQTCWFFSTYTCNFLHMYIVFSYTIR
jgi:hypothetical protein